VKVLGIAYGYHDSAAALMIDGELMAAAQEERFNRVKHYAGFPLKAVNYCLQAGDLTVNDLDCVAFYEKPYLKFFRVLMSHLHAYPFSLGNFLRTIPGWLSEGLVTPIVIKTELGFEGPTLFVKHHLSHASSAFLVSPFEEAAIIVSDGVGEWATMSWGEGRGNSVAIRKEMHYPDSLGLLYTAVTSYLGFEANGGEGKTMGLADWGKPTLVDKFRQIVDVRPDGSFRLDRRFFNFLSGRRMVGSRFVEKFGPPRGKGAPIEDRHRDVAASLQAITEEILVSVARHVHEQTGMERLCLAGGSFLNCPANTRILADTPFKEVFIQPAAGDAGGSLGAAAYVTNCLHGKARSFVMERANLGPDYTARDMRKVLLHQGVDFEEMEDDRLVEFVARRIAANDIVGWFQGRLEFGPRALGNRSILANPCDPQMKETLNDKVKHRESFRPYGVAVLLDDVGRYFEWDGRQSPFMLHVAKAREGTAALVPSAVHVGGTSRIQTVTLEDGLYFRVVQEFQRLTGVGMIINTSFNDDTEPIVCAPEDACKCFANTKMDYLVMGNYVARKVQ
jgi:carbamoyltransferase